MNTLNIKLEQFLNTLFSLTWQSLFLIVCATIGIYFAVIIYTRLFGKRSFSKLSSFDFAMTVAVGSIIATTVLSDSVSLAEGAIGLFMVYLLQLIAAFLRRFNWFKQLIDNQPTLLMDGAVMLEDNMKAVRVTEGDIRSKLRESNVTELSEIKAVIFETTGDIVVIHKAHDRPVDKWIMEDVKR